jgi:hypothetical protein
MSEYGKLKAESKVSLPPNGGMFGDIPPSTQAERRASQAFLKILLKDKRRTQDSFVRWIDQRAKEECGTLYSLVETKVKERLAKNKKLRESEKSNKEI